MQNRIDVKVGTLFTDKNRKEQIYKIDLTGDLTYSNSHNFTTVFANLISSEVKKIILDFKGLRWIDSAGIGVLISYAKKSSIENFEYVITGWTDPVESILKLLNFKKIVKIFSTAEEGISYFSNS